MASYTVNYDDKRFNQVEQDKQSELDKYNQKYDQLINESNQFTEQQQQMVDRWESTQNQIANDNLEYQKDLYEQQKQKAEEEYQKEAQASHIDYQKEVDKYGVSRENVVANGLSNSGYSESSKVNMYNTYQNRVASARSSLNDAKLEFDNAIKEAILNNNATLAENALTALQQKLQIALEGFNYRTEQENNRLNWNYNINNTYYNRYQDVEDQINYENEQAEAIRQWNEQMAFQKQQAELAQQQWEKEYALQQQQLAMERAAQAQQQAYYQTLTDTSSQGTNNGSGKKLTNVKKMSPVLSSKSANSWYSTNIDKVYFNSGLTESQLESILRKGLDSGAITESDVDKILSTFGL